MQNGQKTKPDIDYPCYWEYTVIGISQSHVEQAIRVAADYREHTITLSRASKKGKYISYKAKIRVESEQSRNDIFQFLSDHPASKYVI